MKRTQSEAILRRLKALEAAQLKKNVTFSLNAELMDRFRTRCEKEDVSMASVVEEMIRGFVES